MAFKIMDLCIEQRMASPQDLSAWFSQLDDTYRSDFFEPPPGLDPDEVEKIKNGHILILSATAPETIEHVAATNNI